MSIYFSKISDKYDPMFCSSCACRIGWIDTSISDKPLSFCDDCINDRCDEEREEQERARA